MKTFEEHVAWYIGEVKVYLVADYGMFCDQADEMVTKYRLKDKIAECPYIAEHDDPRDLAREIWEGYI